MIALELIQKTVTISVFVAVMMLVVEYVNVWTGGSFNKVLRGSRLRQYILAALLGATPGCLGAFALVTLHVQRGITLGALVAGMIATSGDEIFVMLSLMPGTALAMTAGLVLLGLIAGWATDTVVGKLTHVDHHDCCEFNEEHTIDCDCYPREGVLALWRPPRLERVVAVLGLIGFNLSLIMGWIGPDEWEWERIAFLVVGCLGLLITATASNEFFREHFWTHVAREHVPRLFFWMLGALALVAAINHFVDARAFVEGNRWIILIVAGLLGVIPTSGPHLLFVTLFADGALPLSVLVTSSAVQDGHGMLPLLATSRRDFFLVKGINLAFGLAVGSVMMALGF